ARAVHDGRERPRAPGRLRAGRIVERPVRRQLQLARPDLVPAQLLANRIAAEVRPLPRAGLPRRDAGGQPARAPPPRARGRAVAPAPQDLRPRRDRTPAGLRRRREAAARPEVLGLRAVPRVLPRRRRRGHRRQPPDRLDRAGRQAAPAIRSGRRDMKLKGQTAIVTGASSGIGKAIAIALGRAGADVVVNYRSGAAEAVVGAIVDGGSRAIAHQADVASEAEVEAMFRRAVDHFGTVDILVNNAGLQKDAPIDQMTLAQWNTVIGVNLTGQFLCTRAAVREFKRRGKRPASVALGKVICISSVHEVIPWAGHVHYAASKGGVMLMMKSVAQELAPLRIRVNSICPGAIRTPINREAWDTPEALNALLRLIPYKRIGEPDDIGKAAVWLASDDSDYVTGA